MQELTPREVAQTVLGGIHYGDDQTFDVCLANCPDGQEVLDGLLEALKDENGATAKKSGCHGSIGGCAMNGVLPEGAYVTIREETPNNGYQPTQAIVRVVK